MTSSPGVGLTVATFMHCPPFTVTVCGVALRPTRTWNVAVGPTLHTVVTPGVTEAAAVTPRSDRRWSGDVAVSHAYTAATATTMAASDRAGVLRPGDRGRYTCESIHAPSCSTEVPTSASAAIWPGR